MINKMKIVVICILISGLIVSENLSAQSAIVSGGGEASGVGGSVSFSVGQTDYISLSGSSGTVNQGVQQPYEFYPVGISAKKAFSLKTIVFPNPSTTDVLLKIENYNGEDLSFRLYDMNGKFIKGDGISSDETIIHLAELPASIYILKINDQEGSVEAFKIIKR